MHSYVTGLQLDIQPCEENTHRIGTICTYYVRRTLEMVYPCVRGAADSFRCRLSSLIAVSAVQVSPFESLLILLVAPITR